MKEQNQLLPVPSINGLIIKKRSKFVVVWILTVVVFSTLYSFHLYIPMSYKVQNPLQCPKYPKIVMVVRELREIVLCVPGCCVSQMHHSHCSSSPQQSPQREASLDYTGKKRASDSTTVRGSSAWWICKGKHTWLTQNTHFTTPEIYKEPILHIIRQGETGCHLHVSNI